MQDLDEGTNFLDIFVSKYISKDKLSNNEIAAKFFVSEPTLYRYISKFNSLAKKLA